MTTGPSALDVVAGHLVEHVDHCTCAVADVGAGPEHEPGCGVVPVMSCADLTELLDQLIPRLLEQDRAMSAAVAGLAVQLGQLDAELRQTCRRCGAPR